MSLELGHPPRLLRIALSTAGLVSVALLIYFAAPHIVVDGSRPFESLWLRLGIASALVAVGVGFFIWFWWRREKDAKTIADAIAKEGGEEDDSAALAERMKDALRTLKKAAGGKETFLYDLPWYVIIGPPGSGKTTALVNSGLRFPLSGTATPAAIAGVSGTRYCDWWFTEDAILVDTAGRYTTQDSDAAADKRSWLAFLDLLKKHRAKQPINGVLVAISLEDLIRLSPSELAAHARAIRSRLLELNERLRVDFPVYALFTKCDLIAGFSEYFADLDQSARRQVWGATFQTKDKKSNLVAQTPTEFDALIERLTLQIPDRLQEEPAPAFRVSLFGFPAQMAALKRPLYDFLNAIFEPTRYHSNANLRGFYFTSGTQHGAPIDQLINALVKNFGAETAGAVNQPSQGKSYFLYDLIQKVIINEAAWVSTDAKAVRAAFLWRLTAGVVMVALCAATLSALWSSYHRNKELVAAVDASAQEYAAIPDNALTREDVVSDRDLAKTLPLLRKLRYAAVGYANQDAETPLAERFGLSQRERLAAASAQAYRMGLERLLRPRLLYRLEEAIDSHRDDPGYIYGALKVYQMLGGLHRVDRGLVLAWEQQDWAKEIYPGSGAQAQGRAALEEHLLAMLDMADDGPMMIEASPAFIEENQKILAQLSVSQRAYHLLRSQASGLGIPDWTASRAGGAEFERVFETASEPDGARVPGFYTYAGFQKGLLQRLPGIAKDVESERWALGKFADQAIIADQYKTLPNDILNLYAGDFVKTWRDALGRLQMKRLTADKPRYVALAAAASQASPIKALFESIRDETALTKEPSAKGAAAPSSPDAALFSDQDQAPGSRIEIQFKNYEEWVHGDPGHRPIDDLISQLNVIRDNLITAATIPDNAQQANALLAPQVQKLKASAPTLPDPFKKMLAAAAGSFEKDVNNVELNRLSQALGDQVSGTCQQIVNGRYPFTRNATSEVALSDFGRLFAPGGIIDGFFKQNLVKYADTSKREWSWRADQSFAKNLSPGALREFQRAAQIRDAFFPNGGATPQINLQVLPPVLSGVGLTAKLEVNGAVATSRSATAVTQQAIQWPGASGASRVAVSLWADQEDARPADAAPTPARAQSAPTAAGQTQLATIERNGAWALFRLLDAARASKSGDKLDVSFVLGGHELQYSFTVASTLNPVTLPALREFHCPSGI
ncbi:type VI secretion system membrane subunit TssM [Methylocystis heyeri]|uniref:Type VI secretion system membrane subunit TssM n=1 Tax=Methylocystis heyeri TaxID=391905 RepID=A0A6B8KKZ8_9HYPH|nr:type VI secretion system membrane subunit TssM [Methylocystis heyeri]QGM47263.1 type VI secretion system membrane subunit TssM [Methylocystis heyeri]